MVIDMSKDTFQIDGYEVKENTVKPHGNGARALVPRHWIGEKVRVVRITDMNSSPKIQPTAVILFEEIKSQDGFNLRSAMKKVVRYRNFSEINNQIVEDFSVAVESLNVTQKLQEIKENEDRSEEIQNFYEDINQNRDNKADVLTELENWI